MMKKFRWGILPGGILFCLLIFIHDDVYGAAADTMSGGGRCVSEYDEELYKYDEELYKYDERLSEYDKEPSEYDMDFSDIDRAVSELSDSGQISFSELVGQMLAGEMTFSVQSVLSWLASKIFGEITANRNVMLQMFAIAVAGAIFTNLSAAFSGKYVAETGFYLTYMMMFLLLAASFAMTAKIASEVVSGLVSVMQMLVPAFCTAVTLSLGISTSQVWYQLLMMLVVAVDWIMAGFLMRLIKVYVVISLVSQMTSEDYFSKLGGLFKIVVQWSLGTILGVTLGLNVIQGMVMPAFDSVKNGMVTRVSSVIPGVGDALNTAVRAAVGSGVLLKNAVGAAGVIVICAVCAWPLIQMLATAAMYKILETLMQPVSDSRLTGCVHVACDGVMLLLKACGTVILLFVISLAMMTSVSNVALTMG